MKHTSLFLMLIGLTVMITACGVGNSMFRHETARRLAAPAYMAERTIPAGQFALTAFERIHARGGVANLYIEGDGQAWLSKGLKSGNPTPTNPMGLHLASKDGADNVIYLARPCQYSAGVSDDACGHEYWGTKRFSSEVLSSYVKAMDDIKRHYSIRGFNLIGYSGGGAIAALLAAERKDVLSLRTVAGNLDHVAHSAAHNVTMLNDSLNAVDYAAHLRRMPQIHFVGGADTVVPMSVTQSYMNALGDTNCARVEVVAGASHDTGFVNGWDDLLKMTPACKHAHMPMMERYDDYTPPPAPIRARRPTPSKP